jgi:hypothetical protein
VVPVSLFVVGSASADSVVVVDSVGDERDQTSSDGVCNVSTSSQQPACTLRAAIEHAESTAGHDTIEFDIAGAGPHVIEPETRLPIMYDPDGVTIDGYSQPGSKVNDLASGSNAVIQVELRGKGPTNSGGVQVIDGLYISSSNNVVRGLAIYNFGRHIYLRNNDERELVAEDNVIVGNFIGTNAAGTFMAERRNPSGSPASNGVHLENRASNNEIGRPARADRNVISGTAGRGIGAFDDGTNGNVIRNNIIGLTPAGDQPLKNWAHGIDINDGSSNNVIGGTGEFEGNVLSGNDLSGIEISHNSFPSNDATGATEGNVVIGNLIGTDATGLDAAERFANGEFGVGLEGKGRCASSCTADIHDNEVRHNVIVGGQANVAIWKGAHRNVVADNSVGVLADGVTGSGFDTTWGVLISTGAFENTIERNRISSVQNGIVVRPDNRYPSRCRATDSVCPADALFPTFANSFVSNSIEGVGPGLGIDLWPVGQVTASPDAALVQNGVEIGRVVSVTTDKAVVEACEGCVVEVFKTVNGVSDHGQGGRSLGTAIVAGGVATIQFRTGVSDPPVVDVNDLVAALVTDGVGAPASTSEFSLRQAVTAGGIGTSPTTTTTLPATTVPATTVPAPPWSAGSRGSASAPAVRCSRSSTC